MLLFFPFSMEYGQATGKKYRKGDRKRAKRRKERIDRFK